MNASDRSDGPLTPAWPPTAPTPALPGPVAYEEAPEGAAPAAKKLNARIVWRAARRHWWQILILWTAGSVGLCVWAYKNIKTNYDATAWLHVNDTMPVFNGAGGGTGGDFRRFMQTQVTSVTSPDVLGATLAKHPELVGQPLLRGAESPEAEIRRMLRVGVVPETNFFTVSLSSESPAEAQAIVDAVVESYLKVANNRANRDTQKRIERLQREVGALGVKIQAHQDKLIEMTKGVMGNIDEELLKERGRVSLERFNRHLSDLDTARLNRMRLAAEVEAARPAVGQGNAGTPQLSDADLRALVEERFYEMPAVATLLEQKANAEKQIERAKRLIHKGRHKSDPTVRAAEDVVASLNAKIAGYWKKNASKIQQALTREGITVDEGEREFRRLEAQLAAAVNAEEDLQAMLKAVEIDGENHGGKALRIQFVHAELAADQGVQKTLRDHISQLEFESKGPDRVERGAEKTQVAPSLNKRLKVMAAAPIGVMAVVLSLFVLLEVRSGRVADPDDLPARVRVEVMGVVPPLPSLRPQRALWGGRGDMRRQRQLDEFMQSLDHLRVSLCCGRPGLGNRRCVMITSACSSEGKTTLSAHLAGRCANAGLSTLVVDADLRNPSLSRLLKVPDGPGLTDVLRDEVTAEAAMMVIEAGGGFHLMPAGTPVTDPSRLLQGDRLAQLIGQLRQAFDIIIMDTPPVLLVPDALTLGRWTDGAMLSVRYDTSRFPMVERAHRRLAAVGVPVLGAVVNGVRSMESYYDSGPYSYAYQGDRSTIGVPAEPTA